MPPETAARLIRILESARFCQAKPCPAPRAEFVVEGPVTPTGGDREESDERRLAQAYRKTLLGSLRAVLTLPPDSIPPHRINCTEHRHQPADDTEKAPVPRHEEEVAKLLELITYPESTKLPDHGLAELIRGHSQPHAARADLFAK